MSVPLDSAVGKRLKFGEFELAPVARTLWRRGEEMRLGSRALDILIALASRPGQIVSKDELTQLVWRGAFVDETALRVGISAVRKALGNGGDQYIATAVASLRHPLPQGEREGGGGLEPQHPRSHQRADSGHKRGGDGVPGRHEQR